jgi:hypothetical protein
MPRRFPPGNTRLRHAICIRTSFARGAAFQPPETSRRLKAAVPPRDRGDKAMLSYNTSDLVAEMAGQWELEFEQAADLFNHMVEEEEIED